MEMDLLISKRQELVVLKRKYDEYLTWENLVIQNEKISKEMEDITSKLYQEKRILRDLRETITKAFIK